MVLYDDMYMWLSFLLVKSFLFFTEISIQRLFNKRLKAKKYTLIILCLETDTFVNGILMPQPVSLS